MSATAFPIVHMNGSGRAGLLEPIFDAAMAGRRFADAIAATAPNMRDFYPLQDGAERYKTARAEHVARIAAIRAILVDLEAIAEHLQEAAI